MYDLAMQLNSSSPLLEALCMLNYLLSNSPSNFHAKLLCIQIYHRMGCAWAAHKSYESLGLKFIQLDSMGYLHCSQLATSGIPSLFNSVNQPTLKFFTSCEREGHESLSMCYKFGSFSKLQEFMDFQDRLLNSHHYFLNITDALLLEIASFGGTIEQNLNALKCLQVEFVKPYTDTDIIDWENLRDNRDLSVIVRWDPDQIKPDNGKATESFNENVHVLQTRATLLYLVVLSVEIITKESYGKYQRKDSAVNKIAIFEKRIKFWDEIFERIREADYKSSDGKYLADLIESRLHSIQALPYEEIFRNLSKFSLSLQEPNPDLNFLKLIEEDIVKTSEIVRTAITEHNSSTDLLWGRRQVQETIANGVEV